MKKKFTFLIAAFMLLTMITLPGKAVGQTKDPETIYYEDFGNPSANTAFADFTGWSATSAMFTDNGSIASHYTGDNNGKVGSANASTGYTNASGEGNCFQTGTKNTTLQG